MIGVKWQNAIPFHVWIKALIIASLIFWTGFGFFMVFHRDTEPIRRTRSNLHPGHTRTDAVILGSSLTERAFSTYGSLDSILIHEGVRINYQLITRPYAVIGDFSPLLGEIGKTAPRAVLIESNILCADLFLRAPETFFGHLRQFRGYFRNIPKQLAASWLRTFSRLFREPALFQASGQGTAIGEKYWDSYKRRAGRYRVRRFDAFPEWNAFFSRAEKAGIRVYLLELPRSREADRYITKEFLEDQERLFRRFEERYHVIDLKFPGRLDQRTYFIDVAHFNREGSRVFSQWMVDRIWKNDGETGR
jgi:hypothetical protein